MDAHYLKPGSKLVNASGLDRLLMQEPCFAVRNSDIRFLPEPTDFHAAIKAGIDRSTKRLIMSCLYVGTDDLSNSLVQMIKSALERNKHLRVTFLTDYFRSQRVESTGQSSVDSITKVLSPHANRVEVLLNLAINNRLLRTLAPFLPVKLGEMIAVHHAKFYIFDDDVILSGANLSQSYLENRLDRHMLVSNAPAFCSYLAWVVNGFTKSSLSVQMLGRGSWVLRKPVLQDETNSNCPENVKCLSDLDADTDFAIIPIFGDQNATMLKQATCQMSSSYFIKWFCSNMQNLWLSSGYFNPSKKLLDAIYTSSKGALHIIRPSAQTNGWSGASGIFGLVPSLYDIANGQAMLNLCRAFSMNRCKNFTWSKYNRSNWTYHCKGIWGHGDYSASKNSCQEPQKLTTIIGSSNYGLRSTFRDVELDFVVLSRSRMANQTLMKERDRLFKSRYLIQELSPQTSSKSGFSSCWLCFLFKLFKRYM